MKISILTLVLLAAFEASKIKAVVAKARGER